MAPCVVGGGGTALGWLQREYEVFTLEQKQQVNAWPLIFSSELFSSNPFLISGASVERLTFLKGTFQTVSSTFHFSLRYLLPSWEIEPGPRTYEPGSLPLDCIHKLHFWDLHPGLLWPKHIPSPLSCCPACMSHPQLTSLRAELMSCN